MPSGAPHSALYRVNAFDAVQESFLSGPPGRSSWNSGSSGFLSSLLLEHLEYSTMRNRHCPHGVVGVAFTYREEGGGLPTLLRDDYILDQQRTQLVESSTCEQSEQ